MASVAMQYCFPYEFMVTQVVAATTAQIVFQKAPNPCVIPNVDSNAGKVSAVWFGIWFWAFLVPEVSQQRNTGSCAIVLNILVVSIVDSSWKHAKTEFNMYTMQNIQNIQNNVKYI
jgi:hypothetical protein